LIWLLVLLDSNCGFLVDSDPCSGWIGFLVLDFD